jgi:serine phosphatase RsbU (regulator of sigma subunit)
MDRSIAEMMRLFDGRRVWMGARRNGYGRLEFVETLHMDGSTSGEPPNLETFEFRCADRGQILCIVQTAETQTESAMCVPLLTKRGILGILYVDNKAGAVPYGEQDLDMLTAMASIVARQLELIVEEQIRLQHSITAGELSFMRELQAKMDPATVPVWDTVQIAVYCKPGLEHAGDIYDMMRLPNGLAAFVCGHVGGSATHAAIAMAETRASFRIAGLHADPPHVLMRAVNWLIYDEKNPCAESCVGIVMNPKTGAMQYATAGDIGAVVVGPRGDLRPLTRPDVPEIGKIKDYAYTSDAGRLQEGETIVLFTPGCRTVTNTAGQALGDERFLEAVSDCVGQTASSAMDELLSDLKAFFREGQPPDDITVVMIHRD